MMAIKVGDRYLKVTLILFGLLFIAGTILYTLLFLPETSDHDNKNKKQSPIDRLFRNRRSVEDDCMWVLIATESVNTLKSPNYPDSYPNNVDCHWLLTTLEPNATISIKIDTLMIESEADCRLDYLQVFLGSTDQAPSLGPYCGNINNKVIETNASTVLLAFHSDMVYPDKGFLIDYFLPTETDCRELLTDASNTLTSPGYPGNYPDNIDCTTLITVEERNKIVLNFDYMDLEYGYNCTFDYVKIFDGRNKNSTLLGQICQQTDTKSFESSTNSLLVHFHSDNSFNKKGYRARYSSADMRTIGNCLWESDKNNGTVTSPNYPENYPSFANCTLWIKAQEGSRIFISFDALELETESNCSYDFLQITEGPPSGSRVLGKFCGRRSEHSTLTSNEHEIMIEFRSDDMAEFMGFKFRYEFLFLKKIAADPEFTFSIKPENATLSPGSSHMLHCNTEHPNARIRWMKGDLFLARDSPLPGLKLLENNTLWIQNMQSHLVGPYTCVAVSPERDIEVTAYIMTMSNSSDLSCGIQFINIPKDSEFQVGEFALLKCAVNSSTAQVTWEKDGLPLKQKNHFKVIKTGHIYTEGVRLEDAGEYSCIVRDLLTGCTRKVSAILQVNEMSKIEDLCGKPKFGQSTKDKSQKDHEKIVGGYNAVKGAYPWQVMLWEPVRKSFCGGTLLNERWIATAAHCIKNDHNIPWDRIKIKLGKHDRVEQEEEEMVTEISDPSAIEIHPGFNRLTLDNDLALIRLRHRVYFTDYILPVCMGNRSLSEALLDGNGEDSPTTRMGTVIGWGKLKQNGPLPRYLQEIKLPMVDHQVCEESTSHSVTRNMFCAGYSQEVIGDSCHGDSGGSFMMKHEERWYMVGVVSWGEGCGVMNKYGFYTRIPNYLSWIQGIIKS